MEQHDALKFDDVDTLIADLETEFGTERALPTTLKDSWNSQYCESGIGGSF